MALSAACTRGFQARRAAGSTPRREKRSLEPSSVCSRSARRRRFEEVRLKPDTTYECGRSVRLQADLTMRRKLLTLIATLSALASPAAQTPPTALTHLLEAE